jgi:hypothetical protein
MKTRREARSDIAPTMHWPATSRASPRNRHVIEHDGQTYEMRVLRPRFSNLADFNSDEWEPTRYREIRATLHCDGKRIGVIEVDEFAYLCRDREAMLEEFDAESGHFYNIAAILNDTWDEPSELTDYGSLIIYQNVWIEPAYARNRVWVKALEILTAAIEGWSIILLKAFPLEFEGAMGPRGVEWATQDAFDRRQKAMMRYYSKHLGVEELPNRHGSDGWMWKPHPRLVQPHLEGGTYCLVEPDNMELEVA